MLRRDHSLEKHEIWIDPSALVDRDQVPDCVVDIIINILNICFSVGRYLDRNLFFYKKFKLEQLFGIVVGTNTGVSNPYLTNAILPGSNDYFPTGVRI